MSDAPETAWLYYEKETDDAQWVDGPETDGMDEYVSYGRYTRADLAPTNAQILADPKVQALVEALRDMRRQFSAYPSENTEQWREEHEACESADAALAALEDKP